MDTVVAAEPTVRVDTPPASSEPTTSQVADQGAVVATTEAGTAKQESATSDKPAAQTTPVKWDSEDNPHYKEAQRLRNEINGRQGGEKQMRDELRSLRTELDTHRRQRDAETQRQTALAQRAQIRKEAEDDGGPLAQKLLKEVEQQEAQERWQEQHAPQLLMQGRQEAETYWRQQYFGGVQEIAEQYGLTQADVQEIAKEHQNDFKGFLTGLFSRGVSKKMDETTREIEKKFDTRFKALETEKAADGRASQGNPDTAQGAVKASNTDDELRTRFARGGNVNTEERRRLKAFYGL